MTLTVDVVRGADVVAPGLSRAQAPLLDALKSMPEFVIRPVEFHSNNSKLLFPYVYGPLPARLSLRRADLVHIASTWYAHLIPLLRTPVVVTCHDLIEISSRRGQARTGKFHRRFHARAAFRGLERANLVVCDSQAVATMLLDQAPGLRGRVQVIYLGIGDQFKPGEPNEPKLTSLGIRRPYLLYVGSEQPRKNLERLVAAWAEARRRVPNLQLVKVGHHQTEEGRRGFLQALARANLQDSTVILDGVDDTSLVELYRGAAVTALISLSEGFGFPPLEAMACGTPVVVSNVDSLPEVTAGAALVVDPLDVSHIADALVSLLRDTDVRESCRQSGLHRARQFTWQKAAREYARAYVRAASAS